MAVYKNYDWVRGDTQNIYLEIRTSGTNAFVNISGYVFFFTMKESVTGSGYIDHDSGAQISKTVSSHLSNVSGNSLITIPNTELDVSGAKYYYDIQMKDASANISTIQYGFINLPFDRTRRTS